MHKSWTEIKSETDIKRLMRITRNFHDSCIKEISYISGAYVDMDYNMYPVNSMRVLNILIQRQEEDCPTIELSFEEIDRLSLMPQNDKYTCEIINASLQFINGQIVWSSFEMSPDSYMKEFSLGSGIIVTANRLRWRRLDSQLGNRVYYYNDPYTKNSSEE